LRAADLNLAIARRTLDSRRQTLALARQRLDRGLISELDVRQFEADVASPAASVADLERQVAQQENALSVLVGHNPGAIRRGRASRSTSPGRGRRRRGRVMSRRCWWRYARWKTHSWDCGPPRTAAGRRSAR